ncbi:DUF2946 family protein [Caenimonas koreensis]|uniref:DUF2946 domain-containing protein n=1 Tax=Caenimonas koreensis DSM 17982 TaxID=1121255 RepID=A0A844AWI5_9BURK|nr:DUF2946 family protein [Caenimonas koreensis]MRD48735.1 DUF2946 domain-containing protein [Caenimonas koreensis DSM 17982]
MQALRRAHFLARLVLAWFVLSLGVAVAAPIVNPVGMQLICSAGGVMKVLPASSSGEQPSTAQTMDCPLCASVSAPPPATLELVQLHQRAVALVAVEPESRIVQAEAAPQPARGPPAGKRLH